MQVPRSNSGLGQEDILSLATSMPASSATAEAGQTRPQAPHSMQRLASMACTESFTPRMAATGQSLTQAVQPVQDAVMT